MATVYGIVKQSDGFIRLDSEPGRGTTFEIFLPRVEDELEAPAEEEQAVAPTGGDETILLVEDEEQVRELALEILTMNGYRVLVARHGAEALRMCEQHGDIIDLMLTDMIMPQMNGHELYRRASEVRPEMKVVFMSGYTDRDVVGVEAFGEELPYIQKPFSLDSLARQIRQVLDGATAGAVTD